VYKGTDLDEYNKETKERKYLRNKIKNDVSKNKCRRERRMAGWL
jgi:hypothetical protein